MNFEELRSHDTSRRTRRSFLDSAAVTVNVDATNRIGFLCSLGRRIPAR